MNKNNSLNNLPKAYIPKDYEDKIYKKWEQSGVFNPDNLDVPENAKNYSIAMPPPNVTGVLHLGHALENAIMDIEVRYQRMNGKRAVLIPGTDHAAVATQAKVEKELIKEGIDNPREELGREELLKKIREYADNSKSTIIRQIKKMGTSCDWSRLSYTFDEKRSAAVNEVFIRMYNDGLIYKGHRVVNWSVKGQSTCSDDELVHKEQKATLYTFLYSKDFPIPISTTRPETKLGDTAVAVHPDDDRYKEFVGKTYTVDVGASKPLNIIIIADKEIDPEFGTGAVGVTPAHSQIDFEMYERHKLQLIPVIGTDGKMTTNAGKNYERLSATDAREKFVNWLKDEKLLQKEEEISHSVGASDRFGDIVEAIPMKQWFVGVNRKIPGKDKTLKDLMREAVISGHGGDKNRKINITPDRFKTQYLHWIDNLRDWCISRQVWWGHRIPVWYKDNEVHVGAKKPEGGAWKQDNDTLDTWFSSGTWTFSTLGWPEKTKDLEAYHPTAWMQMGYEILFFWMARMILMTTYALDDIPFKEMYFHGMLRDKKGQKFSKSLGNGIDPIDMANQYGTDALRLSLILGTTPGNDSSFYQEKVESARNLVNKIWNISRYIISNSSVKRVQAKLQPEPKIPNELTVADKWILSKFNTLKKNLDNALEKYRFSQAGEMLRSFTWDEFADWYLEISKTEKNNDAVLMHILKNLLRMWHPFIPFVTEAIWENLDPKHDLIISHWPLIDEKLIDIEAEKQFELLKNIVIEIRNARQGYKIEAKKKINVLIYAGKQSAFIESQSAIIKDLKTGINNLEIKKSGEKISKASYKSIGGIEIYIPLESVLDFEKEKKRLRKELEQNEQFLKTIKVKLQNQKFVSSAPEEIVQKEKEKLTFQKEKIQKIKAFIKTIE